MDFRPQLRLFSRDLHSTNKFRDKAFFISVVLIIIVSALFFAYEKTKQEPICDNYEDIKTFSKAIPIVWMAKLDGCLSSCDGASFSRWPQNDGYEYPRFSGYYPAEMSEKIPERFREGGAVLKVYGNWTSTDADHPSTVFDGKCVPTVEIEKIEVVY